MSEYIKISENTYLQLKYREQLLDTFLKTLLDLLPKERDIPEEMTEVEIKAYLRGKNSGIRECRGHIKSESLGFEVRRSTQPVAKPKEDTWVTFSQEGGTVLIEKHQIE